jgi:hypothetical protein
MFEDPTGNMWFGTIGGVSIFRQPASWDTLTREDGLVENLVRAIIETRDGSLWLGTYPYAQGAGGITIASREPGDSLVEKIRNRLAGRG